jgi:hypothetical protein
MSREQPQRSNRGQNSQLNDFWEFSMESDDEEAISEDTAEDECSDFTGILIDIYTIFPAKTREI